jgi:cutinase
MGGGAPQGAIDVISRLKEQDAACPNEKFALVGYSQGAGVMHSAARRIPESIQQKIVAMVMFGDPALKRNFKFPPLLQSRTLENCAVGDYVSNATREHCAD